MTPSRRLSPSRTGAAPLKAHQHITSPSARTRSRVTEIVLEQRLGTTPKAMKDVFGGMPRGRIALETGMHSPWVSRVLNELEKK